MLVQMVVVFFDRAIMALHGLIEVKGSQDCLFVQSPRHLLEKRWQEQVAVYMPPRTTGSLGVRPTLESLGSQTRLSFFPMGRLSRGVPGFFVHRTRETHGPKLSLALSPFLSLHSVMSAVIESLLD
ncbi:MAG: hypothetical protein ABIH23_17915, partial [bacterium]